MRRVISATLAAGVLATSVAWATNSSREDLVTACQREAQSSYALAWKMEPSLRGSIETHRRKMSAACAAFVTGGTNTTAVLSQCLHETSAGPVHIQRARNMDRQHIARQRALCRSLGEAPEKAR
ncbi:MAG: hypothetical protein ABL973_14810 [Micropepsaceae bacterium]